MAELALAVVSLTFQVFAGCLKGYQLVSEASDMPQECEHLRVRLKTEQFRLLDWARVIQISEDDSNLTIGTEGRGMLLEVLHQQQELLFRFARYDKHLTAITDSARSRSKAQASNAESDSSHVRFPESEDLLQRALSYIHATRNFPKRLRWVIHDKPDAEILLGKLAGLNNFLVEFLNQNQVGRLLELQIRTNHEIMQLNSTIGQLLNIFQAERSHASRAVGGRTIVNTSSAMLRDQNSGDSRDCLQKPTTSLPHDNLASLAQAKVFNLAIQEGRLTDPLTKTLGLNETINKITSVELNTNDFDFLDNLPRLGRVLEEPRTEGIFRPLKAPNFERIHVWVEWRQMPNCTPRYRRPWPSISGIAEEDNKMTNRLGALVTMLHSDKNTGFFRAARCLGYFYMNVPAANAFPSTSTTGATNDKNNDLETWCGLVFEKPPCCDLSLRPVSLLELLRVQKQNGGGNSSSSTPSLTQRAALALAVAENIERLHAVNWLHKGLRSYNILFFPRDDGVVSIGQDRHSDTRNARGLDLDSRRIDFGRPILSGFDYSRPTSEKHWTEKAARNPAHDIYRHPDVQTDYGAADGRAAFKKSYDYYSLGIVLLEIARWQPVDSVLGVELETASLKHTMPARRRLLHNEPHILQDVRACMGDIMHSAIQACLTGPDAFGLDEASDETDPDVAVRLQRAFYSKVVEKLQTICI